MGLEYPGGLVAKSGTMKNGVKAYERATRKTLTLEGTTASEEAYLTTKQGKIPRTEEKKKPSKNLQRWDKREMNGPEKRRGGSGTGRNSGMGGSLSPFSCMLLLDRDGKERKRGKRGRWPTILSRLFSFDPDLSVAS